jgi:hypothetical protein
MHPDHLLGHDIEVLGRVERDVDAGQRADCPGPLARAVHDDVRLDSSAISGYAGDRARLRVYSDHPGALEDTGALQAGPLRERGGHVDRVDLAVARQPDRADQIIGAEERPPFARLIRTDQLALEVVGLGCGRRPPQLGHAVGGAGHSQTPAPLEARCQPGLLLQLGVEAG